MILTYETWNGWAKEDREIFCESIIRIFNSPDGVVTIGRDREGYVFVHLCETFPDRTIRNTLIYHQKQQ